MIYIPRYGFYFLSASLVNQFRILNIVNRLFIFSSYGIKKIIAFDTSLFVWTLLIATLLSLGGLAIYLFVKFIDQGILDSSPE